MANKRMFSKDVTASDAFLDMPTSTQALYFHLGMEADDDGFIGNPKKVMRVMGVSDDDLKILLSKRFLLSFPSGIVVVKHHRINNNWDKYNCKRTMYTDEFSQLNIKENKAYTLDKLQGTPLQSENSLLTVSRIEENRIDNTPANAEVREVTEIKEKKITAQMQQVFDLFKENRARFVWGTRVHERKAAEVLHREFGIEELRNRYQVMQMYKDEEMCPQVYSPSQFLEKMPAMEKFLRDKKR